MQKTVVIIGSQSGMGYATRQLLERSGVKVIGITNTPGAQIPADLSTEAGVDLAVEQISALSDGTLDGIFSNAGIDNENAPLMFGLNYFGIIRMLNRLQPFLKRSGNGRVVINASNSVVITPGFPFKAVDAFLE